MRFARLGPVDRETPVVLDGSTAYDLSAVARDIDGHFFSTGCVERVHQMLTDGALHPLDGADAMRIGAPVARPSAVYCIGQNYAAHAAESGDAPPENLIVFMKAPSAIAGPTDNIHLPAGSEKLDWEVELAIVIGARADRLAKRDEAWAHIAGYVIGNDLSERNWQIAKSGGQWSKGKSGPGFLPLGPWLVTPDEVNAPDVRLRTWVNGQVRQDSTTNDLIYSIDRIVWELSQHLILEPGDVVLTGTPQGVALSGKYPFLAVGDVVEMEIDGLGRQRCAVV